MSCAVDKNNASLLRSTDAKTFHAAIEAAKNDGKAEDIKRGTFNTSKSMWYGAFVHTYSKEEYANLGMKLFLSDDHTCGFALRDADVISVFKHSQCQLKPALDWLMLKAVEEGGARLDCFDGSLPLRYAKYDFVPVAKVQFDPICAPDDWNEARDGRPSIVFMVHQPNSNLSRQEDIVRNIWIKAQIESMSFSSYDEAIAIQKQVVQQKEAI